MSDSKITVSVTVNASIEKVWKMWNTPEDIILWCSPSPDWHTPYADNDLRKDGKFKNTMAAKDGSMQFDFEGVYSEVIPHNHIAYTIADGRKVTIDFAEKDGKTEVVETFDPETINPVEMQRAGWQAIMDNFKYYVENNNL